MRTKGKALEKALERQEKTSTRKDLARVLEAEQVDEDEIRSALRRAAPIRENLLVMRVKMMAELKTVLTTDQLQLLEESKAHRIKGLKARIGPVPEDTTN